MPPTVHTYTAYIHTAPEPLWEALTDPAVTRRYFDFMEGPMAVESAWAPGAPVVYRTDDGQAHIEGQVVICQRPSQLVITFALLYDPELRAEQPSRLSWQIVPMGEVCKLTVTHDDLDGETKSAREAAVCLPSIVSALKILLETGRLRMIKEIVFDCASPLKLATFWAAATGHVLQAVNPTFAAIADPRGIEPELAFQQVPEPKGVKNRVHLDLHVADITAEAERLIGLGAHQIQAFDAWTVMADPEGNEFCITS